MTGFPSSRHHACNAFLSLLSKSSTPYHSLFATLLASCATFRRVPNPAASKQTGPSMSLDELRVRDAAAHVQGIDVLRDHLDGRT